ncbi:MAG: PilZ domain-containing protein [Treponema sp.]|nr:PilZ domain-containing protein [Treponema sp.]
MFIFIIIFILILCIFFFTRKKENSVNWLQFFSKGKEAGFSVRELEQLRRLILNSGIEDPASMFTSQKQLEKCIRSVIYALRISGESEEPGVQDFLSRLFDFCKEMGVRNSEKNASISTSRQISEGQTLRVLLQGIGIFKSEVVKNTGNSIAISRPINPKISASPQWQGQKISIYFWREDDAGYVFDTEVIDEVFSKGISSLKVDHNDSLFRTQRRKSMRIKFHKPAYVYLTGDTDPGRIERAPGLKCMLDDISDTGCAFRVKGHAEIGLRLKVQFALDRVPICMPGTVRSVDYHQMNNISLIHMESDLLPISTKNHILCEVFDLLPDDDDDELPFRVLEEEADNMSPSNPIDINMPRGKFNEVMNG